MKLTTPAVLVATFACMTLSSPAMAQHESMSATPPAMSETASKAVNAMCPVGKEAIDPSTPTAMYKGKEIGFCCPGCGEKFLAWDEEAKDQFVVMAVAGTEPGSMSGAEKIAVNDKRIGDPYMLTTCPISGGELGGMGDAIVKVYDGREVRFCCAMCLPKFEENQAASFEKIDAQIIASQLPYYPLTTCVVSDEGLNPVCEDDPTEKQIDVVFNNRLVRLCCKGCEKDLKADPDRFLSRIDKAVIAQQRDNYPMDTCLISDEHLEEGEIVEVVAGNRLFRFCCNKCKRKFKKDPTKVMAALDEAWAAQGGFKH